MKDFSINFTYKSNGVNHKIECEVKHGFALEIGPTFTHLSIKKGVVIFNINGTEYYHDYEVTIKSNWQSSEIVAYKFNSIVKNRSKKELVKYCIECNNIFNV